MKRKLPPAAKFKVKSLDAKAYVKAQVRMEMETVRALESGNWEFTYNKLKDSRFLVCLWQRGRLCMKEKTRTKGYRRHGESSLPLQVIISSDRS